MTFQAKTSVRWEAERWKDTEAVIAAVSILRVSLRPYPIALFMSPTPLLLDKWLEVCLLTISGYRSMWPITGGGPRSYRVNFQSYKYETTGQMFFHFSTALTFQVRCLRHLPFLVLRRPSLGRTILQVERKFSSRTRQIYFRSRRLWQFFLDWGSAFWSLH